jgi:hypothetical protein
VSYPAFIESYIKAVAWVRLYDFSFAKYDEFTVLGQSVASVTITADHPGLTFSAPAVSGALVQTLISGGTPGVTYTVTCSITTSPGNYALSVKGKLVVV